jgi:hypothetical protein
MSDPFEDYKKTYIDNAPVEVKAVDKSKLSQTEKAEFDLFEGFITEQEKLWRDLKPPQKSVRVGKTWEGDPKVTIKLREDGPQPANRWGMETQIADAATLRNLPLLTGLAETATGDAPFTLDNYMRNVENAADDRMDYVRENPIASLGADIVGSTLPINALFGLASRGANAVGQAAGPTGTAVSKFVTGEGGRFLSEVGKVAKSPNWGNWLLRRGSDATAGALQGAATGALLPPVNPEQSNDMGTNALIGAAGNMAARPVLNAVGDFFLPKINETVANLANKARVHGLDVRGGQIVPQKSMNDLEKIVAHPQMEKQARQATKAAAKSIGLNNFDDLLDDAAMQGAQKKLHDGIENWENSNTFKIDADFANDMKNIKDDLVASSLGQEGKAQALNLVRMVEDALQQKASTYGSGVIPGKEFRELTGRNSTLGKFISSDNTMLGSIALKLKDALLNGMNRNSSNPGELQQLRRGLYNWFVVNNSRTAGMIDPEKLFNMAQEYRIKGGPLKALIDNVNFLPKVLPSGAVETLPGPIQKAAGMIGQGGSIYGSGIAGQTVTGPIAQTLSLGAGAIASKLGLSSLLNSPGYRNALLNKALGKDLPTGQAGMFMDGLNKFSKHFPANLLLGAQTTQVPSQDGWMEGEEVQRDENGRIIIDVRPAR